MRVATWFYSELRIRKLNGLEKLAYKLACKKAKNEKVFRKHFRDTLYNLAYFDTTLCNKVVNFRIQRGEHTHLHFIVIKRWWNFSDRQIAVLGCIKLAFEFMEVKECISKN